VESSDVWSTIRNDEVSFTALKCVKYIVDSLFCGDVALKDIDAVDSLHILQIDTHDTIIFIFFGTFALIIILIKAIRQNLAPRTWRCTQVNSSLDATKNVEFLINLEQFICRSGSVAFAFSLAVVGV